MLTDRSTPTVHICVVLISCVFMFAGLTRETEVLLDQVTSYGEHGDATVLDLDVTQTLEPTPRVSTGTDSNLVCILLNLCFK